MKPIRVLIVDDHFLVRVGLKKTLLAADFPLPIEVVAEADTAAACYALLEEGVETDLILLDIMLPDGSGVEIAARVSDEYPHYRVLVLSAESSNEVIEQLMEINIGGFVSKGVTTAELARAIESVMEGVEFYGKDIARLMHNIKTSKSEVDEQHFTEKELEVLHLAAQGLYAKEIAEQLGISPKTVSVHKSNIFRKLGISNSVELVHYALRRGFIKA